MRFFLMFCVLVCGACSSQESGVDRGVSKNDSTLFERLTAASTGIDFTNNLTIREDFDVFRYRNFYNGGGVAIADLNRDSLPDLYLTSNMGSNKLFLNKGNWQFEDITEKAGVEGTKVWSTGVSVADVNADGLLDIYVCNSGDVKGARRENELFINNGDLTFTERAVEYGLADKGFSTHAVFFDYDKDGDLDCYVLNNSFRPVSTLGFKNLRDQRDPMGGDKLYQQVNGKFVDVSERAGIFGSVIGFGLGITVGDINNDNWPDLYISNDFYERDYLYINNRDGTFREQLEHCMGHLSMFSMGADLADINNDGYPDLFSTDMLPEDDYRLKTLSSFETYDVYQLRLKNGYYHQYMRNMLQLNNQNGTFSEIGELAGVAATDWSWGALITDFDNDSNKDIFVCNGIYKDLTDMDFVEYLGSSEQIQAAVSGKKIDFSEFVDKMTSTKLGNYMFTQQRKYQYTNVASSWGLGEPSFSNGAAYGDLDNDGDLDLVVNNVNQETFVYRNRSRELNQHNFLSFSFEGSSGNKFGLGTTVKVYVGDEILTFDHMPIRGFQSSMDYKMVIGLGKRREVDSVIVRWPDHKVHRLKDIAVNRTITLKHSDASPANEKEAARTKPLFAAIGHNVVVHRENDFNDFDRDRLLYHMLSTQGPGFAKADLNQDGLEDFFIGGATGYTSKIYLQNASHRFLLADTTVFSPDAEAEDVAAEFFDAEGDGDPDLYVVSGGSDHLTQSPHVLDRLYINKGIKNGVPVFEKSVGRLPPSYHSGSCVKPADVDKDGDLDLFIGTRVIPSYYGLPADQVLLLNDGRGYFTDVTASQAPDLKHLGMVTDAAWFDYDANGFADLILVGEWMPVTIFTNDGKRLTKLEHIKGLEHTNGWWNRMKVADLDLDGDPDFVLGNQGLNSKFKPSATSPISLYVNDFDQNGSIEPLFAFMKGGEVYPFALRQDIIKQMSSLKKQFIYYKDYADKSLADMYAPNLLKRATKLNFYEAHSSILLNQGDQGLQLKHLPIEAQVSPVYGIEVLDANGDGNPDIIIGGNLFSVKPEVGRYDALQGLVLLGDGDGNFHPVNSTRSGILVEGEVRAISVLNAKGRPTLAFILNNDSTKFYLSK